MAHKLARLVYRMLKYGQEYVDKGMQYYEERHRQQQVEHLKKTAAKLGPQVVEAQIDASGEPNSRESMGTASDTPLGMLFWVATGRRSVGTLRTTAG